MTCGIIFKLINMIYDIHILLSIPLKIYFNSINLTVGFFLFFHKKLFILLKRINLHMPNFKLRCMRSVTFSEAEKFYPHKL